MSKICNDECNSVVYVHLASHNVTEYSITVIQPSSSTTLGQQLRFKGISQHEEGTRLSAGEEFVITLVGSLLKGSLLPEVGSEVRVRPLDSGVGGLGEVTKSGGLSDSGGVAIGDTSHLEELLGDGGRHDAGTTGSGDKSH